MEFTDGFQVSGLPISLCRHQHRLHIPIYRHRPLDFPHFVTHCQQLMLSANVAKQVTLGANRSVNLNWSILARMIKGPVLVTTVI